MESKLPRAQVLVKAMALLEVLLDGQHYSVSELARRTGLNRTTVHRLLATLSDFRLIDHDVATERIKLGLRFLEFGRVVLEKSDVRQIANPYLRRLSEITGETAYLAMLDVDRVVYVDKVESPHAVRLQAQVGATIPLHCTAPGKAFVATMESRRVRNLLARTGLPPRTERTITSIEVLEAQLAAVRRHGYAIDDAESEEGVRCVAASIPGPSSARAAICIAGPAFRLSRDDLDQLGGQIVQMAREVSQQLGYRG